MSQYRQYSLTELILAYGKATTSSFIVQTEDAAESAMKAILREAKRREKREQKK